MNKFITFCIINKNGDRWLEECIKSVINVKVPKNIFVIDGGSTDRSIDIITFFSKHIDSFIFKEDKSQIDAINIGIKKSRSLFFTWINSDDCINPKAYENIYINYVNKKKLPDIVYGNRCDIDINSNNKKYISLKSFSASKILHNCFISQPSSFIKLSALNEIGGISEEYKLNFDYELWLKFFKKKFIFCFVDETFGFNRNHIYNLSNTHRFRQYIGFLKLSYLYSGELKINLILRFFPSVIVKGLIYTILRNFRNEK